MELLYVEDVMYKSDIYVLWNQHLKRLQRQHIEQNLTANSWNHGLSTANLNFFCPLFMVYFTMQEVSK